MTNAFSDRDIRRSPVEHRFGCPSMSAIRDPPLTTQSGEILLGDRPWAELLTGHSKTKLRGWREISDSATVCAAAANSKVTDHHAIETPSGRLLATCQR